MRLKPFCHPPCSPSSPAMAVRALSRLRHLCRVQLHTLPRPSQEKTQVMVRRFAASASSEEGIQVESKSASLAQLIDFASTEESSVLQSDNKATNISEESSYKPVNVSGESASASEESATLNAIQTPDDRTKFEAALKVEIPFLRFVRGRGGERIEKDTNAQLFVPRSRDARNGTCVVVKGPSQEAVDAAVAQIENMIQKAEKMPNVDYTHFISIPLALHPSIREKFTKFRESAIAIMEEASNYVSWFPESNEKPSAETVGASKRDPKISATRNVDPDLEALFSEDEEDSAGEQTDDDSGHRFNRSIFLRPETFHLTVLMLKLSHEKRVSVAADVLQGVKSKVLEALEGRPINIHLKGMEVMKGIPAKANILCMRVQQANQENRLLQACQIIIDAFIEKGFVPEEEKQQQLKLHATLVNTANRYGKKMTSFDARQILIKHRSEDWGQHTLSELHLSQRFVYDKSGYYHCCGAIQLPTAVS